MNQVFKTAAIFLGVMLAQLYLAQLLELGELHPDFILVFLVFLSARYGRISGILVGFGAGLLQDVTGSLSVLGANALAKSVVGYTLGTLNGTSAVWTSRVVNIYIYVALVGHAIIYQVIMSLGLHYPFTLLVGRILLEAFISSILVTGLRFIVPLMPQEA